MKDERPNRYRALRQSQRLMVFFSRVALVGFHLAAAIWFGSSLYTLLTLNQTDTQRAGTILVGVAGLVGFGLAGFIFHRVIRSLADVIEVLLDAQAQAGRAADVVEQQLLPLLHAVERRVGMPEAERVKYWAECQSREVPDPLAQAYRAVRDALQREWWHQAARLAEELRRQFPTSEEARRIDQEIAEAKLQRRRFLFEQARAAGRANDWPALQRVRDRLKAFATDEQLPRLDNEIATELLQVRRELEQSGKKREAGRLAVHLSQAFPHTEVMKAQQAGS